MPFSDKYDRMGPSGKQALKDELSEARAEIARLRGLLAPSVGADWHTEAVTYVIGALSSFGKESRIEKAERIVDRVAALVPRPTIDRERVWEAITDVRDGDGFAVAPRNVEAVLDAVMAVLDPDSEETT